MNNEAYYIIGFSKTPNLLKGPTYLSSTHKKFNTYDEAVERATALARKTAKKTVIYRAIERLDIKDGCPSTTLLDPPGETG